MKQKNGIFWWFRKRKKVIAINNRQEENIIETNKNKAHKEETIPPIQNTVASPIPLIPDNNTKEYDRDLPHKKNERITLVKPKRGINTETVTVHIKEKNINEEPIKKSKEKQLIIEEEKKEDAFESKDFIDDDNIYNEIAIDRRSENDI